jgi:hypothetical protein
MNSLALHNIIQIKAEYPGVYEDLQKIQQHINQNVPADPGPSISPSNFVLSPGLGSGASVTGTSGSVKRGKLTLKIGTTPAANPNLILNIPKGVFTGQLYATFVQSGGTGTLPISYSETSSNVTVTFTGTPTANSTYIFTFTVQD